jgi:D-alanine transaminase
MTTRRARPLPPAVLADGVAVITLPDMRWRRCDIKSVSLLPNVLAKQKAVEAKAYEAWLVDDDGRITEGTSTNAWIVTGDGRLITRERGPIILGGITRAMLLEMLRADKLAFEERPFTIAEAKAAAEAFLTSSSNFVVPVTRLDGSPIGDGRPGAVTRRLRELYLGQMEAQCRP